MTEPLEFHYVPSEDKVTLVRTEKRGDTSCQTTEDFYNITTVGIYVCTILEDLKNELNSVKDSEYIPISGGYIRETLNPINVNNIIDGYIRVQKYKAAIGEIHCEVTEEERERWLKQ